MRHALTLFLAIFSSTAFSYSPLDYLPQGSRVGLEVATVSGQPLALNSEQLFPPASTLKLVTALAAKIELGDSFRFTTEIQQKQNDLIIQFSGDPTLTTHQLEDLIMAAKAKGVTEVKGNILLNNQIFSGYERGVGWPWDILGVCYSAPASAITLDKNCVQASIYTNNDGSTRVHVPAHQPISVASNAITVSETEQKERQCDLELTTADNNRYQLSGCLKKRNKPLPLKFAVQHTDAYAAQVIRQLLKKHAIKFNGLIKASTESGSTVLSRHQSAPLPELLKTMLQKSDNLIADNLTKTLGQRFFVQPGSFNNGTEAIKQIIFSRTGIDLNDAQLADGSGLSRNNRMTAADMNQILRYIWRNDSELQMLKLLPTAGESGTLKYRKSMRKSPVKGHVIAKSGSLYGSYNMAGYTLNSQGEPQASFVQFVTDYYPVERDDEVKVTPPIFLFEQAFYQDLFKLSSGQETPELTLKK